MRTIEDVTRELTDLERRAAFALESCNVGIWEWKIDKGDWIWDTQMLILFGVTKEEYNDDRVLSALIHPEDMDGVRSAFRNTLDCNTPFDIVFRSRYIGDWKHIRMRGSVHCDADGSNKSLIGVAFSDTHCCLNAKTCEVRR